MFTNQNVCGGRGTDNKANVASIAANVIYEKLEILGAYLYFLIDVHKWQINTGPVDRYLFVF